MAEERDVRKSMDTLAKQLTMDVDSLKSQHNRLYSQVGRGGQCAHHNTYPQLVVVSIVSYIDVHTVYLDCTYALGKLEKLADSQLGPIHV